MKKIIAMIIIGVIALNLIACTDNELKSEVIIDEDRIEEIDSKHENIEQLENIEEKNDENASKDEDKYKPIVTIEELPIKVEILDPDSVGTRYMEATYENNSKYTIKGLSVTVLLKNKNEKTYLSIYDTVLKDEMSPKFETVAPKSGNSEDYEILSYEITVEKDEDTIIHIIYDVETKAYSWF